MNRSNWLACGCGIMLSQIPGSALLYWRHCHPTEFSEAGPPDAAVAAEPADVAVVLTQWKQAGSVADPLRLEAVRAYRSLARLNASEYQAMAEAALSLPREEQDALLGDVLSQWAIKEGEAAVTWALKHRSSHHTVTRQIGSLWGWRDPRAVLAWQGRMIAESESARLMITHLTVETWLARSDAEACAQAWAASMQENYSSDGGGWIIVTEAVTTPEQAQAFARGLEAGEEKLLSSPHFRERAAMVLSAFSERWQEIDPDGWEAWAASQPKLAELASSSTRGEAARFILAQDKASEAARWMSQIPPEQQPAAMSEIIDTWAARDLDAAGAWLAAQVAAQGGGETTWAAAEAFAKHAAAIDPEAAFHWAAAIGDPARRARAERQAFLRWHDADAAAAIAWLDRSGWNQDQQTAVREMAAVRPAR